MTRPRSQKIPAKHDTVHPQLSREEVHDLTEVVGDHEHEGGAEVGVGVRVVGFGEKRGCHVCWEVEAVVSAAVDVADGHVDVVGVALLTEGQGFVEGLDFSEELDEAYITRSV